MHTGESLLSFLCCFSLSVGFDLLFHFFVFRIFNKTGSGSLTWCFSLIKKNTCVACRLCDNVEPNSTLGSNLGH